MEGIVDVFVEIPKNSQNKYEYDKEKGVFRLDRVLYSPMHYPADYGYIEETLAEDGDPLDVLVLVSNPTFPGCVITTRLVGALIMSDDKGEDTKLLGVPVDDPRFNEIQDIDDVPTHIKREIGHFFKVYKDLENKKTEVGDWKNREFAIKELEAARRLYATKH